MYTPAQLQCLCSGAGEPGNEANKCVQIFFQLTGMSFNTIYPQGKILICSLSKHYCIMCPSCVHHVLFTPYMANDLIFELPLPVSCVYNVCICLISWATLIPLLIYLLPKET